MIDADRELALIADAQRDPSRFGPLYEAHVDSVWRFAYSRLGSRERANDATSQTFIKALAALPTFAPRRCGKTTTFGPWLMMIARNVIIYAARQQSTDGLDGIQYRLADHRPSPDQLTVSNDERHAVRIALTSLPPQQRRVVEMRLDGASGREIAETVGMSVGAVKTAHYGDARALREMLSVHDEQRRPKCRVLQMWRTIL